MRYGYMSGSGYGSIFIMILLLLIALVVLFLFVRSLNSRQASESNPRHDLIIEILKHRYVTNEISADQYMDMKRIIEAEALESAELLTLKEQFARGEMNVEGYWQQKSQLK